MSEEERKRDVLLKTLVKSTFRYSGLLWDSLFAQSKMIPARDIIIFGYPAKEDETVRVFEGIISRAGAEAGLSENQSLSAMRLLGLMNGATVLRRAVHTMPSVVLLHYKPTEEQFLQFKEELNAKSRRIAPNRYDELRDQVQELRDRIVDLEEHLQRLADQTERLAFQMVQVVGAKDARLNI